DTCDGTSDTCQHLAGNAGTVCRVAADECDVARSEDRRVGRCRTAAKQASATECTDDCNLVTTDTCNGTSDTCKHVAGNAGTLWRVAADECAVAETGDRTNAARPTEAKRASATPCTEASNLRTTDTCDGTSDTCQHLAGNAGTVCRAAADECDVA